MTPTLPKAAVLALFWTGTASAKYQLQTTYDSSNLENDWNFVTVRFASAAARNRLTM